MVWGVNKLTTNCFSNIAGDVIFQRKGIMFNIHNSYHSAFDIYRFWCSGVNIFVVDRTVHEEEFLQVVNFKIKRAQEYNETSHYKPIGLAVMISAKNPIDVDEEADIIILKDVYTAEDITEYKKKSQKKSTTPILIWFSDIHNLDRIFNLIKVSDGVVLDLSKCEKSIDDTCACVFMFCRQVHKPVFSYRPDLISEYTSRKTLLPVIAQLANTRLDGIIITEDKEVSNINDTIYNIVCAFCFIEQNFGTGDEIHQMRAEIKTPILPAITVALASISMLLNSDAKLIVVLTRSGKSASWVSSLRPPCHVLAITTQPQTARMMHLYKNVIPILYDEPSASNWQEERRNRVSFGTIFALKIGLVGNGAKLVVLAPTAEDSGYCDTVQITSTPYTCH